MFYFYNYFACIESLKTCYKNIIIVQVISYNINYLHGYPSKN